MTKTYAIVVTFNRCELLSRCLTAIVSQTRKLDRILIVDNASTDSTGEMLVRDGWLERPDIELFTLPNNRGGAGGFAHGMRKAIDSGADWLWMMDDDAAPLPDAFENLFEIVDSAGAIYGSVAKAHDEHLCWPLCSLNRNTFNFAYEVPAKGEVPTLPFLGILISRETVLNIGYPDADYFIAGDDTEYCFRARSHGLHIFAAGRSHLLHPPSEFYRFGFGKWAPLCFYITPWKRYYDVRNRILTSWKKGGIYVWTRTLPATLLRLIASLINEPERSLQLRAYIAGTCDGLRKIKGKRHQLWRL
ncbi:MAG: glycosyltransferase family 2 protein [Rhodanobacter thiooxydans]|nr:glycosyltransferase family 2 protein [Rhodanobacter thiooxydans]